MAGFGNIQGEGEVKPIVDYLSINGCNSISLELYLGDDEVKRLHWMKALSDVINDNYLQLRKNNKVGDISTNDIAMAWKKQAIIQDEFPPWLNDRMNWKGFEICLYIKILYCRFYLEFIDTALS